MSLRTEIGTGSLRADSVGWDERDARAVDTIRLLAADAVERAGSGHPGTAMSLAPVAYLLFRDVLRHDPADDQWLGRDRFVLSCGHSSLTLYIQLYLTGYGLELDDLRALRTWGSRTPGHPEYHHTRGVEITTGPLGQGLAGAVGMAMAARRERGLLDPEAPDGTSPFDHRVYVIASDGDMMEGVTSEASSLAGHQELDGLIVLYDQNRISIEDDTDVSFSEDVGLRYEAYGWHVQHVDWTEGGTYVEDVDALHTAIRAAEDDRSRPSLIVLRTIIGWPAPTKQNTGAADGSALGADEVAATKRLLGFDPDQAFVVEPDVLARAREVRDRGRRAHDDWRPSYEAWRSDHPGRARLLDRLTMHRLPVGWQEAIPTFDADPVGVATRAAVRTGARCPRACPPRAVGRVGRSRLEHQHHHGRGAVLPPGRPPDGWMEGRSVRSHPPFRHPGARHGIDHERHRPVQFDPALRRDIPGLQRLHAARGPPGRADAATGHLRVDPRLDRPR